MTDLRYSIRALLKTPRFAIIVVLTLALGIGASTAIFSVVDAVLLRPLPYPDAERIVSFAWRLPTGESPANVTPLTFQYWHEHAQTYDGFAVTSGGTFNLASGEVAERVSGVAGTADFFKVIGVPPAIGRGFSSEECVPGAPRVAVISHGLWQRIFGGLPDAIGKSIALNDRAYTVIGVMPAGFSYEPQVDLVTPLQLNVDARDRGWNYEVIGRLRPGTTIEQAQSDTDRLFQQFTLENPQHVPRNTRTIGLIRYQDYLVADLRPLLLVLLGAVGLVLLIACGNVANLLLARSTARHRDVAIRSALGASRNRQARQVLTESLILSLAGGVAGAVFALALVRALIALIPGELPRFAAVAVDARALLFAMMASAATGAAFGLLGIVGLLTSDPGSTLKATSGHGHGVARNRVSSVLIVCEVAFSVVLLTGAALLIATFANLRAIRIGFDTANILTAQLSVSSAKYGSAAAAARLDRELTARIGAIAGVASVTTASNVPLERGPNFIFGVEGDPPDKINYVELRPVGPDYLRTLGIPLRAGRALTVSDAEGAAPVVVVNEALARSFGGAAGALGRRVILGRTTPHEDVSREIVGVVSNVADGRPGTRLFPTLYLPRSQFGGGGAVAVLIRTSGSVPIASEVRRAVQSVDAQAPVTKIRSMNDVASAARAQQRFNMILVSAFAGAALVLTMIGLYGLLSYQVARRVPEIGVRMALGARRADVLRMIVSRGLGLTAVGLSIGLAGSLGLVRFLKTLLFGVSATSPWVFAAAGGSLLLVAVFASLIPARRATRVDPIVALRAD